MLSRARFLVPLLFIQVSSMIALISADNPELPSTSVKDCGARGDGIADDAPSIQRAIDTVQNHVVYVPNGKYKLGSGLVVKQSHLQLLLDHSAVLLKGSSVDMLRINADDVTIKGGTFDGQRAAGFKGGGIVIHNSRDVTIADSTIDHQDGKGIYLTNVSGFRIEADTIIDNGQTAIFGEYNTTNGQVEGNIVNTADGSPHSHGIAFHSTHPGMQIQDITISKNQIKNGAIFCVEVGAFGGVRPANITVGPSNDCEAVADIFGGISFDSIDGGSIIQNTFDSKGQSSHAAVEVVQSSHILVSANKIYGTATLKTGIAITGSHDGRITGNAITGFFLSGIKVYAAQDRPSSNDNDIEDNALDFGSASNTFGIWFQSNGPSAAIDRNIVRGNIFDGEGRPGNTGVRLERDFPGSLDGSVISRNIMKNLDVGTSDGHSTNTRTESNTFQAVRINRVGAPSARPDNPF